MAISNGVMFLWTGTNASIPSGWSRVTAMDGYFPKVHANSTENPNLVGGASTHSHTSPAHSHTMNSHNHSVLVGDITFYYNRGGTDTPGSHVHGTFTSGSMSGGSLASVTSTYSSVSNTPPYFDVIFITPTTVAGGIPDLAVALTDDTSFVNNTGKYNGYYNCDGNNSTPNMAYKYLRGADAGANAGGTGGSYTNVHTLTHSHGSSVHSHAAFNTGSLYTPPVTDTWGGSPYGSMRNFNHAHDVSLDNYTDTPTDNPVLTTSETVEPAYKALLALQNRSSTPYTPVGILGMWIGLLANIPSNFEFITTYYSKYLKIGGIVGDIGVTGGSNTHTHTGNTHTHRTVSHTHSATQSGHPANTQSSGGDFPQSGGSLLTIRQLNESPHTITVYNETLVYSTATTSADSASNEPVHKTVALIRYKGEKGGAFLFNLIR